MLVASSGTPQRLLDPTTPGIQNPPFVTPARLLTFDGVDESPSGCGQTKHTHYCPLCMQYYEGVYVATCCGQNICGGCGTGLVREAAKKAATLQAVLLWSPSSQSGAPAGPSARHLKEKEEERATRQKLLLSALNMNLVLDAPHFREECVLNPDQNRASGSEGRRAPTFCINVSKVASLVSVVCPYCFRFLKVRPCNKPPAPKSHSSTAAGGEGFESYSPEGREEPIDSLCTDPSEAEHSTPSPLAGRGRGPYASLYSSSPLTPNNVVSSPRVLMRNSSVGGTSAVAVSYPVSARVSQRGHSKPAAGMASRYARESRSLRSDGYDAASNGSSPDEEFCIAENSPPAATDALAATMVGVGLDDTTQESPLAVEPPSPATPFAPNHRHSVHLAPSTPSPSGRRLSHPRGPPRSDALPTRRTSSIRPLLPHATSHNGAIEALRPDLFVADTFVGPRTARVESRAAAGSRLQKLLPPGHSSPRRPEAPKSPYLLRRLPTRTQEPPVQTSAFGSTPERGVPTVYVNPSPVRAGDDFVEMQRKLMKQLTNATYRSQFSVDFEALREVERNLPKSPARVALPPIAASAPQPVPPATTLAPPAEPPVSHLRRLVEARRRGSSQAAPVREGRPPARSQASTRSTSQPQQRKVVEAAAADDRWCPVM